MNPRMYCKRGHLMSSQNTRLNKKGHRCCKACMKMTPEERRRFVVPKDWKPRTGVL